MQDKGAINEVPMFAFWEVLKKRKLTVLITGLVLTTAAVVYAFVQPNRYRADVFLSVEGAAAQDYMKPAEALPTVNVQEKLWLIRENLFSPSVLEQVAGEFHLYGDERGAGSTLLGKLLGGMRDAVVKTAQSFHISLRHDLPEWEKRKRQLDLLRSRIKIQVEASDAFSIGFEGQDPEQVANATNRLAELLVQQTSRASQQRAGRAAGFLEAEAERTKQKLDQQNQQIQGYQHRMGDELPANFASNLKLLETLEGQLLSKQEQISNEEARRAAIAEELSGLAQQGALESKAVSPATARLEDLRAHLKELQTKYTEEHPEIRSVEAEIRNLEKSAAANPAKSHTDPSPINLRYVQLKAEQEATERRLKSYQKQEQDLTAQIQAYRGKVQSAPEHERTLAELTRDYELTRTEYQSLIEKQNQAELEDRLKQTSQSTVFRIVRPAQVPWEPYSPYRGRIIALGLLSGLCLGLLLAVFAEYRDTTYGNVDELRNSTNLPVLAVIPTFSKTPAKPSIKTPAPTLIQKGSVFNLNNSSSISGDQIVTLTDPRSIATEQYGLLAMQFQQMMAGQSSKVVTVTSAVGGEGKTITSINLSVMLSRTKSERVLLVECDLRKSRFHEYLGVKPSKGFADLLRNPHDSLEPYVWGLNQLTILPGGTQLLDPLEALTSPRMRMLFERLRREFQCIVVDSPPILPIADSRILADLSDGVILVVRARQTQRELLQHALESFKVSNLLGVVLNGVELERSPYAYAYEYYEKEYLGHAERRVAGR